MTSPLIELYGENAIEDAVQEIEKLASNSNFGFDNEYVKTGTSFITINANEILEGKQEKCSLRVLVSKSFGEAAISKFNI